MRNVDELDFQIAQPDAFACFDRMQIDFVVEPILAQLVFGKPQGQRRPVNRHFANALELRHDVWQCANVIFMPMGNDDATKFADAVLDVADVGNDEVDTPLPLLGKFPAGIDDDEVAVMLDDHHTLANFGHPTKRYHPQPAIGALRREFAPARATRLLRCGRGVSGSCRPRALPWLRVPLWPPSRFRVGPGRRPGTRSDVG